jgi:uncharacterized protein YjbI with pentapeptide repeats
LKGVILVDANLEQANLSQAVFGLSGTAGGAYSVFGRANLTGANLAHTQGVSWFQQAVLQGANLTQSQLSGSNFEGANLQGANLQEADLSGCNMKNADLRSANLQGTNLKGANLEGANFEGATGVPVTGPGTGIIARAAPTTRLVKKLA